SAIEGENVVIDLRAGDVEAEFLRTYARDLIAKGPRGGTVVAALRRGSRAVPIGVLAVADAGGRGVGARLAEAGGDTPGFTQFEFGISAKCLELLKETAPKVPTNAAFKPKRTTM